ncbi:unnamed protein product [Owenia fusiformis]|uniref:MYND-type domain-containing protein n=1 Tax=Owenia fusiformis TaxID=6347 RepID=A0A8S4PXB8_OWEFU|nr:unnamed protein product [Owenia fusiformis]
MATRVVVDDGTSVVTYGDWSSNDSDEKFNRLYEACQSDDETACLELGKCYVYGPSGFHKDILLGEFYIAKAARQGNKEAIALLNEIPALLSEGPVENRDNVWIEEASAKLKRSKGNCVLPRLPVGSFIYITKNKHTDETKELHKQSQGALMDVLQSRPTVWPKEIVNSFGDSPTARKYAKAIELMQAVHNMLVNPPNKEDRFKQVEGIHLYMEGHFYEPMAKNTVPLWQPHFDDVDKLITDTLKENKNDFACRLLRICMYSEIETYRSNSEDLIVALEVLVNDINLHSAVGRRVQENQDNERTKMIKCNALEFLGALYCTSNQVLRSNDSYRKCLDMFPSHLNALYSIAFNQFNKALGQTLNNDNTTNPMVNEMEQNVTDKSKDIIKNGSESAFKPYLEIAPKCHRKYHFALYMSAFESLQNNNCRDVVDLYEMAVDVEKKSLPMYHMQNKPAVYNIIVVMYPFIKSRLCANTNCTIQSKDLKEVLRAPPGKRCSKCKMVRYCTSDCQAAHWPKHKLTCKRLK